MDFHGAIKFLLNAKLNGLGSITQSLRILCEFAFGKKRELLPKESTVGPKTFENGMRKTESGAK
jgi:hypothetical protein